MHMDPRTSSIGQSLGGYHPDESNLRDDMCLIDPEALRLESIRGLSVQIRQINQTLMREPIGSVDQGELSSCLANLGQMHELMKKLSEMK